jgi:hypothetical protein
MNLCVLPFPPCRLVALDANFKKLEDTTVSAAYRSTSRRLLLLDYDGTLIPHRNISAAPPAEVEGGEDGFFWEAWLCLYVGWEEVSDQGLMSGGSTCNSAVCE